MGGANTLSALGAAALLAAYAAVFAPGAASAGEFETNKRRCVDPLGDPVLRAGACTWLLQSGRIAEDNIPIALYNRGIARSQTGDYDRAIEDYSGVLRIRPDAYKALSNRGGAWYKKGDYDRAIEDYTAVLGIAPDDYQALTNRGVAWARKGAYDRAISDYKAALRIKPDYAEGFNSLAWLRATASEARVRDGPRAVTLAESAVSLRDHAQFRDTLAAAYAEAGRFGDAVDAQERAIAMARAEGWSAEDLADAEDRLRLYRQDRPYRATNN